MLAAYRDARDHFVARLGDARLTQPWFLRHVPVWLAIFRSHGLAPRDGLRVLEIGSWEGLSCRFALDRPPGSHRADDVLVDAIRRFEAWRPGGVMICDDYLWKFYDRARDNPGAAINAFLRLKKCSYDLIHAGWQVAIVKRR